MGQNASSQRVHAERVALTVKVVLVVTVTALMLISRGGREWNGLLLVCALSVAVLALAVLVDSSRCGRNPARKAGVIAPTGSDAKAR